MKLDYSKYSESTRDYMKQVERFIKKRYGSLNKEWNQPLTQIAELTELSRNLYDQIQEQGISYKNKFGYLNANPLIKNYTTTNKTLLAIQKEFGITPAALVSINHRDKENDSEDSLEELAKSLLD